MLQPLKSLYTPIHREVAMFKKRGLFLLVVAGFCSFASAAGDSVAVADSSGTQAQPALKEWSVLMYGVPVDAARFAIKNIDDAMAGVSDATTSTVLCCDLWKQYASLWQISSQAVTQLAPILEQEAHSVRIARLMDFLKTQYPAQKYALIVQGGGAAFVDHAWDAQTTSWAGHTGIRRGILYNDMDGTYLSLSDLVLTLTTVSNGLGRKLDLFVADAGYMTGLELVTAFSDSVQVYVAPESQQYLAGFKYKPLFQALAVPGATAADVAAAIVQTSAAYYNDLTAQLAQPATQCYAAIDCAQISRLWNTFNDFMTQLNALLATRSSLAASVYQIRPSLGLAGLSCCYVDCVQWLKTVQPLLAAQSDDTDVLSLSVQIPSLVAQFQSACASVLAGADAGATHGLMLCYPQAKPGIFTVNQAGSWNQFVNASFRGGIYA